jgi:glucose/arabinose dehydrogenase
MTRFPKAAAALLACAALAAPLALAQFAPPQPTPEQLARTFEEDQLSAKACGVPRNAADDHRPAPAFPGQTRAPRVTAAQDFTVEVRASGLNRPFAFAFLPSGRALVTLRGGELRVVDAASGAVSPPVAGLPAVVNPIRVVGLNDVALDRDFAANRRLYLTYTAAAEGGPAAGFVGRIASARLSEDETTLSDVTVLKEAAMMIPRRVVQAADGTLFILTADILPGYRFAQSTASPSGKVLRIKPDGAIPADNPFAATAGADPSVWATGFRDAQGAALHPATGEPWLIENHPRGGDELNVVRAGRNYGFPVISYGRDNDGKPLGEGKTAMDGMEQPLHFWTPSVAFSGMAFYQGDALPGWKGDVFLGGLSGQQLVRLDLEGERVVGEEKLLRDRCKRIRDVRQGPDGALWLITDEENGELIRLAPAG